MKTIKWKLYLSSPREKVFDFLNTPEGRAAFWAESAEEENGFVVFKFVNGMSYRGKVLSTIEPSKFEVDYFYSRTSFRLEKSDDGGTNLSLVCTGVKESDYEEMHAGWISVLMALKAAADFNIDLRNHDPKRCWDQGYVDN